MQHPFTRDQPFALAGCRIRTLIDRLAASHFAQGRHNDIPPMFDARSKELHHELITVSVDDQPWQGIGLSEHQTDRLGLGLQALASRHRRRHPRGDEGRIRMLGFRETPGPRP